jgi:hypothetical protein
LFLSFGIVLFLNSQSVVEHILDYTDITTDRHGVGRFDIKVDRDMEPPIWAYFELDDYHQNHRRHLKSRSNTQLSNFEGQGPPSISESDIVECQPWVTTGDRVNYPCGVVAKNVFNDTYRLYVKGPEDASSKELAVDSRAKTIAWPGDVNTGKFINLAPEGKSVQGEENQALLNMWILQRFPPVICQQEVISEQEPLVPVYVGMKNVTFRPVLDQGNSTETEREVPVTDCSDYYGHPRCNFTRDGKPFTCTGNYREVRADDWGVENGHFLVWMRIAGMPRFMKLWGLIETPIKAGSTVTVHFVSNCPVKPFHGRKAFVLSTASDLLGGRNDFLGIGYLTVGSCCLIFGLAFLWRHLVKPRPLGDISLLCGRGSCPDVGQKVAQ